MDPAENDVLSENLVAAKSEDRIALDAPGMEFSDAIASIKER